MEKNGGILVTLLLEVEDDILSSLHHDMKSRCFTVLDRGQGQGTALQWMVHRNSARDHPSLQFYFLVAWLLNLWPMTYQTSKTHLFDHRIFCLRNRGTGTSVCHAWSKTFVRFAKLVLIELDRICRIQNGSTEIEAHREFRKRAPFFFGSWLFYFI